MKEATKKAQGSPPQVRGKLINASYHIEVPRITPAGAGKTPFPLLAYNLE